MGVAGPLVGHITEIPFAGSLVDDHRRRDPFAFGPYVLPVQETRIAHERFPTHERPAYELAYPECPTVSLPPTHGILENPVPGGVGVGASCPGSMALETDGTTLYRIVDARNGVGSGL